MTTINNNVEKMTAEWELMFELIFHISRGSLQFVTGRAQFLFLDPV